MAILHHKTILLISIILIFISLSMAFVLANQGANNNSDMNRIHTKLDQTVVDVATLEERTADSAAIRTRIITLETEIQGIKGAIKLMEWLIGLAVVLLAPTAFIVIKPYFKNVP